MASHPWPPSSGSGHSPSQHPSAYPPPIPPPPPPNMVLPPELQALNITPQQFAALLSHFQAGTVPFPVPPPPPYQSHTTAAPPTNMPIPPPQFPLHPGLAPSHIQHPAPANASNGNTSHMDVDREEGEVSDAPRDQDHSLSVSSASKKRKLGVPVRSPLGQGQRDPSPISFRHEKKAALPFIAALHQEGFTFAEFVQEGFNEVLLREVYRELGIPIRVEQPEEKVKPASVKAPIPTQPTAPAPTTAPTTAPKPSEAAKVAKPAAPMSRQDYLARLQAAKTKKADVAPAASAPAPAPAPARKQPIEPVPTTAAPSSTRVVPSQEKATSTKDAVPAASVPKAAKMPQDINELVRKKLEVLKAANQQRLNGTPSVPSTPLTVQTPKPVPTKSSVAAATATSPAQGRPSSLIPGLYMSSAPSNSPQPESLAQTSLPDPAFAAPVATSNSVTPQPSNAVSSSTTSTSRKRPVASDLNEASSQRPYKRPFGQSRQNSSDEAMIIEVSEDEDSSDEDDGVAPLHTTGKAATRQSNLRDRPVLRDFPPRPTFTKQQSVSTPPLGTPGVEAEQLRKKELEIRTLHNKIKEIERRKATTKEKDPTLQSRPQTPLKMPTVVEKSTIVQPSGVASTKLQSPATPSSGPPFDRRAKIQADLSAGQVQSNAHKARLLELQKEMEEIQRKVEETRENEQKLRDELESVDVNTEGMTKSQMEAKMDELLGSAHPPLDAASTVDASSTRFVEHKSQADRGTIAAEAQLLEHEEQDNVNKAASVDPPNMTLQAKTGVHSQASLPEQARFVQPASESDLDEGSSMSESIDSEDEERPDSAEPPQNVEDHALVDVPEGSESGEVDEGSSMSESSDSEVEEAQDKLVWLYLRNLPYSSSKDDLRPMFKAFDMLYQSKNIHAPRKGKRGAGFAFVRLPLSQAVTAIDQINGYRLQGRDITVQMARNDPSPDTLSPEPSREPTATSSDESSSDDEMDISSEESESESDVEDESNVEPKTLEIAQTSAASSRLGSSDDSSSKDEDEDDDEDEDEEDDDDRMDLESPTASSSPIANQNPSAVPQNIGINTQNIADDLAPELQPDNHQQSLENSTAAHDALSASNNCATFVPYESILKKFKSYRFHPNFLEEVPGGYRSLTYNHQIDRFQELCRYESAAGVCNDHSCDGQHFRDMPVPDDAVIVQMATEFANHGRSKEEVDKFNSGLSTVLQQVQAEGNASTEELATRIAHYRRDYLQDPTNILGLNVRVNGQ